MPSSRWANIAPQSSRVTDLPPSRFLPPAPPTGPVDDRPLSDPRRPLLLHLHVSMSMQGLKDDGRSAASLRL